MSSPDRHHPDSPAWNALAGHHKVLASIHMRELFDADPDRYKHFSLNAGRLFLDYSKNRINAETVDLLVDLAEERGLQSAIEKLLQGHSVNFTEQRPALHTALRADASATLTLNGRNIIAEVQDSLERMATLIHDVEAGRCCGMSGKKFSDAIAIGIGGSSLGPALVSSALAEHGSERMNMHFASNLDPHSLLNAFDSLDPETTLVLVASKSFTTLETSTNAASVRNWFKERGISDASTHFFAITANPQAAIESGFSEHNIFEFWDWVGGRFSLWSAIGLPIALSCGITAFQDLLRGAAEMDEHFATAPLAENAPVMLALLGAWYGNFFGCQSQAIVPYDERLYLLPSYLQQLEMESNGKSVTSNGEAVSGATAPVIWGGIGTDSQHAFFQLLHHGTHLIPTDFLVPLRRERDLPGHHQALVANAFAQSRALMWGRTLEELEHDGEPGPLASHRAFSGNRPSNTIVYDELDAHTLGALIAMYEHKVFVQGILWDINSFDQWGVELGKDMARSISRTFDQDGAERHYDSSTSGLVARYLEKRTAKK